ncbi:hypothetical protein CY34DRAFT_813945 [Suillus luteus UH-Slu-Lm8-n1]|uniref:Uncharacterized protein n=1 Tax=Suillus luteus UH-Slu-Lm8-n1 TaxID=930992 RepID=A0A0C9Z690_9AGAM|nr:hypothetical protein CY34DRAFT_813945 [Suillus luteus UH-Slu-Lm8-n1]
MVQPGSMIAPCPAPHMSANRKPGLSQKRQSTREKSKLTGPWHLVPRLEPSITKDSNHCQCIEG